MKFSFTILYVKNIKESISFYEKAFGLKCRFIHESNLYAEMETGNTTLGFTQHELIESMHKDYQKSSLSTPALGMQITFEPDDVDTAFAHAVKHGAKEVMAPKTMPWEWRCAMVRDPNGFLIELAKPPKS